MTKTEQKPKPKPQKPKRKKETEAPAKVEAPKKKSTGIRTAVRYGEISPELALHRLEEARSKGEYVGEEIINWLKNRKKPKKKSVEAQSVEQEDQEEE